MIGVVDERIERAVFGLLFETSSEALFIIYRATRRILSANVRMADLLACDVGAVIGQRLDDLFWERGERDVAGPGQYEEVSLRRADDYPVYVTLTVANVDTPRHGAIAACTARDTTDRRMLESELVAKHSALFTAHAELETAFAQLRDTKLELEARNREIAMLAWRGAIGELVAGIAHHLNNPVGALASTIRRMSTIVTSSDDPRKAELERLLERVAQIASRIESNVHAVVSASQAATAGELPRLELPPELSAVMSRFTAQLDNIPVPQREKS